MGLVRRFAAAGLFVFYLLLVYLDGKFWLKFLSDAGLPQQTAKRYSDLFCENRLTLQHLRHLDKDLLKEMKINAVGDIITILQHCKSVDIDVGFGVYCITCL